MRYLIFLAGFVLALYVCGDAAWAIAPQKTPQTKQQPKKKKGHRSSAKKPDARTQQAKAEAEVKRHENDARLRQFQQMQQAQQRGYQQRMQSQQGAQPADR